MGTANTVSYGSFGFHRHPERVHDADAGCGRVPKRGYSAMILSDLILYSLCVVSLYGDLDHTSLLRMEH